MKKVYVQEILKSGILYHAGSKARIDCDSILESMGYQPCNLYISKSRWIRLFSRIYYLARLSLKLKKVDCCFLQYPYYAYGRFHTFFYKCLLKGYSGKLECLLHDIVAYREGRGFEEELGYLLPKCDKIIVHTPAMKEILINQFRISHEKIRILYLFDYLTNSQMNMANPSGKVVVFAGNLSKSLFLKDLSNISNGQLKFHLYGVYSQHIRETDNCVYCGKFHPDDVAAMDGDWGLVWDGDSLDTCGGTYGEYLRINSSHKISLYLSSGKPVIVWSKSALSTYIVENHLGIAVNSLYEIFYKLESISDVEKKKIIENVSVYSRKLRDGYFLKTSLNS